MSTSLHSLTIRALTPAAHSSEVLLDGEPLKGVTKIEFSIDADRMVVANITMLVAPLEFDGVVYERLFTSKEE